MVINTLVAFDVEAGSKVIEALEHDGVEVTVALWAKLEDYGDWRLYIASRTLDDESLFDAYSRITRIVGVDAVFSGPTIALRQMSDSFIAALRSAFSGTRGVMGMRLGGQIFGGHFVEEAWVYKVT